MAPSGSLTRKRRRLPAGDTPFESRTTTSQVPRASAALSLGSIYGVAWHDAIVCEGEKRGRREITIKKKGVKV
jgi:hypothetical protein